MKASGIFEELAPGMDLGRKKRRARKQKDPQEAVRGNTSDTFSLGPAPGRAQPPREDRDQQRGERILHPAPRKDCFADKEGVIGDTDKTRLTVPSAQAQRPARCPGHRRDPTCRHLRPGGAGGMEDSAARRRHEDGRWLPPGPGRDACPGSVARPQHDHLWCPLGI